MPPYLFTKHSKLNQMVGCFLFCTGRGLILMKSYDVASDDFLGFTDLVPTICL